MDKVIGFIEFIFWAGVCGIGVSLLIRSAVKDGMLAALKERDDM